MRKGERKEGERRRQMKRGSGGEGGDRRKGYVRCEVQAVISGSEPFRRCVQITAFNSILKFHWSFWIRPRAQPSKYM